MQFTLGKGKQMKSKSGFTLVEILIVVVILGILAAIVIPQFTNASTEARENSLKADLQTMRSQIELYKIQHNDTLPGGDPATDAQFATDMTEPHTYNGKLCGPYMMAIPKNCFNANSQVVTFVDADSLAVNTDAGWNMDPNDGTFNATSEGHLDW
jgi:general secretion pathway protein G